MPKSFPINPDVEAQFCLEYTGETAIALKAVLDSKAIKWPETHYEKRDPKRVAPNGVVLPETLRVYAPATMREGELAFLLAEFPPVYDFARLQFRRTNGARIACFRPSDENPQITGFGEINPVNGRKCDENFSETYVDRIPGTPYTNYKGEAAVWHGFEPVWLKIKSASGNTCVLKMWTEWNEDGMVDLVIDDWPSDVPPTLAEFEFSERSAATRTAGNQRHEEDFGKFSDFETAATKPRAKKR